MKLNLNLNKDYFTKLLPWFAKTWPAILIAITIIAFVVLSFFALYPRMNQTYIEEGMAKVRELDIRFDTKLISELEATKQPSELKASGGRDPFAGY
jgi:hypothetical protein